MDVSFTMTAEDLTRFGRYCLFHRPRVLAASIITGFGTGVLVTGGLSLLLGHWPPVVQWWFFPLNIAFTVLNLWKTRFGITQALKDIPGLLGDVSLRVTPSGIEAHTSLTDDRSLWARVTQIAAANDAVYLFTEPCRAYIIPRRAFVSPAEANAFLALARSYHEAAGERRDSRPAQKERLPGQKEAT